MNQISTLSIQIKDTNNWTKRINYSHDLVALLEEQQKEKRMAGREHGME